MANYETFFRNADKDGSNTLSFDEIYAFLSKQHYKIDKEQLKNFFGGADINNDKMVTFDEYLVAMEQVPPAKHSEAMLRSAFHDFDVDGNGVISASDLKQLIGSSNISDEQLLREAGDADGSGDINFEEFVTRYYASS